jgi:hypothetical protein
MKWFTLSFAMRLLGIVPLATSTWFAVVMSKVYAILIAVCLLASIAAQISMLVLHQTENEADSNVTQEDAWGYVTRVTALVIPTSSLFLWHSLRRFFRQPLFLTFIEYTERREFSDLWVLSANVVMSISIVVAIPVCVLEVLRDHFSELEATLPPYMPIILGSCNVMSYFMVFAACGVIVVCFKFAHISAYTFAAETMESQDIYTVCSRWSIFIILTRSLSTAFAPIFIILTSLSFYLVIVMVIMMVTDQLSPLALAPMITLVLAGLVLVVNAADVESNSNHAISLVNMIDFTKGAKEIDHDKAACVTYLKATDIGFRVGNEPISMGLALNSLVIFVTLLLTVCTAVLM